ncbi:MAG: glucose 1-dehydrogenase [Rhodospirillaceae bacterium]|jgi:NAD(P)-dependent dehydrogenase (short-subunit alcohol dehydrogenase family)|nr:glucose 1-dehydrogenase [Rhodospirillaceae bacterium]MBT6202401.1 glucose 1-dehydrogenase [Rhodospirillaceae bacterium]MBT6509969.1 glucose 1-dehydrogenase [Rhodospirillaceae bacterium]MBT7611777.1 glucose 1-dehydrogenase [Rhodospirillaceae bacterium]
MTEYGKLFDLSGKVAIVTGSSRGIGEAVARALAAQNAKVVVSSRRAEGCEPVAEAMRAAGGEAVVIPCNVSHEDQLQNLVDQTLATWGRIDTLVCNAAANPHYGPFLEIPDDMYDKTMLVNVRNVMKLCRMAIPAMTKQGGGSIVITSSTGALHGSDYLGTYCLTKAADVQMVKNIAVAHGRDGITANAILPGLVKTHFAKALWEDPDALKAAEDSTALGRIGDPIDLAGIVVYLASAAGRWTTGQSFVIDGGWAIYGE